MKSQRTSYDELDMADTTNTLLTDKISQSLRGELFALYLQGTDLCFFINDRYL